MSEADLRATLQRVLAAHASHALPVAEWQVGRAPPNMPDDERLEHQRLAIARIMKRAGLAGRTVVEFGCGDGSLSRTLFRTGTASSFLLIDRNRKLERAASSEDGFTPSQLVVDVAALQPSQLRSAVNEETSESAVMLSNHMCGAALDSAILCALNAWQDQTDGGEAAATGDGAASLAGIVAVTCCHHACSPFSFLGRDFLREAGLSAADFDTVCKWSRMAPRRERSPASRPRVVKTAQQLGLTPHEAAQLGSRCRQLMDSCRARFLEQRGFSVSLVHHVGLSLTADNVMILATRQGSALPTSEDAPAPCPPSEETAVDLCAPCAAAPPLALP